MGGIHDEPGRMAVWLNTAFDEENDTIGWFDHDHAENGAHRHPVPLRALFDGFSYADSWLETVLAAAARLGVAEARNGFVLFDYAYDGEPGPFPGDEGAWFLGNFTFDSTAGSGGA